MAAGAPLPRRQLLLKVDGQPARRLAIPAAGVSWAPLAPCGAATSTAVQFAPLLLVEAGGCWALSVGSNSSSSQSPTLLHVVLATDGVAAGAPPAVLGVGVLELEPALDACSGAPPDPSIRYDTLRWCHLACPATGREAGSVTLAARLVRLPQPPPQPPPPAQVQAAPQPAASPPKGPQRLRRSAGVQAGSSAAADQPQQQPACVAQPPVPAASWTWGCPPFPQPLPLLAGPGCGMPAVMGHLPWPWQPAAVCGAPVLGVPVAVPTAHPAHFAPAPPGNTVLDAAPAPDPLPPQLAAVRTRVQEQRQHEQQSSRGCRPSTAGDPQDAAAGVRRRLRSPLKVPAESGPRLEHHLRELPQRHRWVAAWLGGMTWMPSLPAMAASAAWGALACTVR